MQMISHTDANHADIATFPTKHKHTYIKMVKKKIYYLSKKQIFIFLAGLILFVTQTMLLFFHQDAVFERNLFHNGHKQ